MIKIRELRSKKTMAMAVILMIILSSIFLFIAISMSNDKLVEISIYDVLDLTSDRNAIEDMVITSDSEPMLALIATPVACWYNIAGVGTAAGDGDSGSGQDTSAYGLKPLLVAEAGSLELPQDRFVDNCDTGSAVVLGDVEGTGLGDSFKAQGALDDAQKKAARERNRTPSQPPVQTPAALARVRSQQRAPAANRRAGAVPILGDRLGENQRKRILLGG